MAERPTVGKHVHPTGQRAEVLYSRANMRILPATRKYIHISIHVRILDSGWGRGNLIRVFTPFKACLSPSIRGVHKSSSSVTPCVASYRHSVHLLSASHMQIKTYI